MSIKNNLTLLLWGTVMLSLAPRTSAEDATMDQHSKCLSSAKARGFSIERAAAGCRHAADAEARYADKQYEAAISEYKRAYELLLVPKLSTFIHDIWDTNLSDRSDYIERALNDIEWCLQVWRAAVHREDNTDELNKLNEYRDVLLQRRKDSSAAALTRAPTKGPVDDPPALNRESHPLAALEGTFGAVGLVALAVGAGFGVDALNARSDIRTQCHPTAGSMLCSPNYDALERRRSSSATTSDVSFAIGGAFSIAAIVILIVDGARGKITKESKASLAIHSHSSGTEVTLAGHF